MRDSKTYNRGYVILIAAIAGFGGLLFGFSEGVISGALLLIKSDPNLLGNGIILLPVRTQEWIVSVMVLGAAVGALGSGRVTDRWGRKKVLIVTGFIFAAGSILLASANSVFHLIIGRFIIGFTVGVFSYSVPLYISELSPSHVRGALVSISQLAVTIGIFIAYIINLGFSGVEEGWRWMFLVGLIPALILGIGMFFLPETPRWLMSHNMEEQARNVLDKVGEDRKTEVLKQIKVNIQAERQQLNSSGFLRTKWVFPTLIIGLGIMMIAQFTGINTLNYYAPTIFEMAGFGAETDNQVFAAILPSIPLGFVLVIFTILSMYLVDRWGRKPLLYLGLSGMILSLTSMGIAFTFYQSLEQSLKWVSFISMIIYIPFFALSLGPIAWLLISEIFPAKIRGIGMSIASMANWMANFLITNTFLSLGRIVTGEMPHPAGEGMLINPGGAFFIYAVIGILGIVFVYAYIPETKGHSLEHIEKHFLEGKHPRRL